MTPEQDERAAMVAGLRALADHLETHPDLPLPGVKASYYPRCADEEEERAEIDWIATMLGTTPESEADGEHYLASRQFGPVLYQAAAITRAHMRRYSALMSYSDAVEPVSKEGGR